MRSIPPSSKRLLFKSLESLPPDYTAVFRDSFFRPQKPVVFPRQLFRSIPAVSRWFVETQRNDNNNNNNNGAKPPIASLNYDYLNQHSDCHVPLELTQRTPENESENENHVFKRFHAPLSLFLEWTRMSQTHDPSNSTDTTSTTIDSTRLYLAQCQLLDLPVTLRSDFPTPSVINDAARGDVYDANIWLGVAPTYTPLHRDPNPNLFVQLAGSKRVRILPPETGLKTFAAVREKLGKGAGRGDAAYRGEDMMQGPERELLDREVWGDEGSGSEEGQESQLDGYEATVEAGDGVFIPLGWWHSIKGVGDGITASANWWFR